MILKACKSKNYTFYYVQKSFRTNDGKCSTKNVERLGTIEDLKARFGESDPVGEARKYVAELTAAEKDASNPVTVGYSPTDLIRKGERRSYNGGYLFLQKIYYELGLDYVCKKIEKKHRNRFDLNGILSRLLYTRLLYPPGVEAVVIGGLEEVLRAAGRGHTSCVPGPEPACHRVQ